MTQNSVDGLISTDMGIQPAGELSYEPPKKRIRRRLKQDEVVNAHATSVDVNGTSIGEIQEITPPMICREVVDVTEPSDCDESFVLGNMRLGELSFTATLAEGVDIAKLMKG